MARPILKTTGKENKIVYNGNSGGNNKSLKSLIFVLSLLTLGMFEQIIFVIMEGLTKDTSFLKTVSEMSVNVFTNNNLVYISLISFIYVAADVFLFEKEKMESRKYYCVVAYIKGFGALVFLVLFTCGKLEFFKKTIYLSVWTQIVLAVVALTTVFIYKNIQFSTIEAVCVESRLCRECEKLVG